MFKTRKVTAEIFSTVIAIPPQFTVARPLKLRLSSAKIQIFLRHQIEDSCASQHLSNRFEECRNLKACGREGGTKQLADPFPPHGSKPTRVSGRSCAEQNRSWFALITFLRDKRACGCASL